MLSFLSIGVPAWNEADSIVKTLGCLINQTAWNNSSVGKREIIVAITPSGDDTEQKVTDFMRSRGLEGQIKIVKSTKRGKLRAMKKITEAANHNAPHVFFVDADTLPHRKMIEYMAVKLQDPKVEAVSAALVPVQSKAKHLSPFMQSQVERFAWRNSALSNELFGEAMGISRKHFHLLNVQNQGIGDDLYLTEKIGRDKIAIAPGARTYFKLPSNSRDYLRQKIRTMAGAFAIHPERAKEFSLRNLPKTFVNHLRQRRTLWGKIGAVHEFGLRLIASRKAKLTLKERRFPKWHHVGSSKLV